MRASKKLGTALILLALLALPSTAIGMPAGPLSVRAATPSVPSVVVKDQPIVNDTIAIQSVVSDGPGWIVLRGVVRGQELNTPAGYAPVKDGRNTNVVVRIDSSMATAMMRAILYIDGGVSGKFEYPGPDAPASANGKAIDVAFNITGAVAGEPTATAAPTATPSAAPTATPAATGTPIVTATLTPTASLPTAAAAQAEPAAASVATVARTMTSAPPAAPAGTSQGRSPWPLLVLAIGGVMLVAGLGLALTRRP